MKMCLLVFAALLLAACAGDHPGEPVIDPTVDPLERLELAVQVDPDDVVSIGRFTVHLSARNVSGDTVRLGCACDGALGRVDGFDTSGTQLRLEGNTWPACEGGVTEVVIAPGQVVERSWELRAHSYTESGVRLPLPTGSYEIRVEPMIVEVDGEAVASPDRLVAPLAVFDPYDLVDLTFELSRTTVAVGDTFLARLTIVNATADSLEIAFGCWNMAYWASPVDLGGEWVRIVNDQPGVCYLMSRRFTVAPGDTVRWVGDDERDLMIVRFEATRRPFDSDPGGPLAPGQYIMQGHLEISGIRDAPTGVRVLERPFEVVPAQP